MYKVLYNKKFSKLNVSDAVMPFKHTKNIGNYIELRTIVQDTINQFQLIFCRPSI